MNKQSNRNAWKGLVAGVVGGVVASWTMDRFQYWWLSFGGGDERELQQAPSEEGNREEPATVKTASAISEGVFGHSLTAREKEIAGPIVHYAVGTTAGAVYGLAAEYEPDVTTLAGIPFGRRSGWSWTKEPCLCLGSQKAQPLIRSQRMLMRLPHIWCLG
jgi:hypothetical protein